MGDLYGWWTPAEIRQKTISGSMKNYFYGNGFGIAFKFTGINFSVYASSQLPTAGAYEICIWKLVNDEYEKIVNQAYKSFNTLAEWEKIPYSSVPMDEATYVVMMITYGAETFFPGIEITRNATDSVEKASVLSQITDLENAMFTESQAIAKGAEEEDYILYASAYEYAINTARAEINVLPLIDGTKLAREDADLIMLNLNEALLEAFDLLKILLPENTAYQFDVLVPSDFLSNGREFQFNYNILSENLVYAAYMARVDGVDTLLTSYGDRHIAYQETTGESWNTYAIKFTGNQFAFYASNLAGNLPYYENKMYEICLYSVTSEGVDLVNPVINKAYSSPTWLGNLGAWQPFWETGILEYGTYIITATIDDGGIFAGGQVRNVAPIITTKLESAIAKAITSQITVNTEYTTDSFNDYATAYGAAITKAQAVISSVANNLVKNQSDITAAIETLAAELETAKGMLVPIPRVLDAPFLNIWEDDTSGNVMITNIQPGTSIIDFINEFDDASWGDAGLNVYEPGGETPASVIGTGKVVKLENTETVFAQAVIVIYGDVCGDGAVSPQDILLIQDHTKGTWLTEGAAMEAADINHDGVINSTDMVILQNSIKGTDIDQDYDGTL